MLGRVSGLIRRQQGIDTDTDAISALNEPTDHLGSQTMDTQRRHESKKSKKLGQCGRQNMLRPYTVSVFWDFCPKFFFSFKKQLI